MPEEFYEQSRDERLKMAGDPAEDAVRRWFDQRGILDELVELGFRHVSTEKAVVAKLDVYTQHTPDFAHESHFIEAQGCNSKKGVIFKYEKLAALWHWHNEHMPVFFAIYAMDLDALIVCDFDTVLRSVHDPRAKHMILESKTSRPKEAEQVPVDVLLQYEVVDTFAAWRMDQTMRKVASG